MHPCRCFISISGVAIPAFIMLCAPLLSRSAIAQQGRAPSPRAQHDILKQPRSIFWLGNASSNSLNSQDSWSLLSKATRKELAEKRAQARADDPTAPEEKLSYPPGALDTLFFEDDASVGLGPSLEVTRIVLGGHSLRVSGQGGESVLKIKDGGLILPDGEPGAAIELSDLTFMTGGVQFGDSIALLRNVARDEVKLDRGAWEVEGPFSLSAGTLDLRGQLTIDGDLAVSGGLLQMRGGTIESQSFAVFGEGSLNVSEGLIHATSLITLAPNQSGSVRMGMAYLGSPTIAISSGAGRHDLEFRGTSISASRGVTLELVGGFDGDIRLQDSARLSADRVQVQGEGTGRVAVDGGSINASTFFRVSAGSIERPGLVLTNNARVTTPDMSIRQGVMDVGASGKIESPGGTVTVLDGVLRLTGGTVECGELHLLESDAECETPADWPNRPNFRSLDAEPNEDSNFTDDPEISRQIGERFLATMATSTTRPAPELTLLQHFAPKLKGAAGDPGKMIALGDEFNAQLNAMRGDREQVSQEEDEADPAPQFSPLEWAKLMGSIQRADSDVGRARSLHDLGAIMDRATKRLNGKPGDDDVRTPEDPLAVRIANLRLGGPKHASVLEGYGTIMGSVKNSGIVRIDTSFSMLPPRPISIAGRLTQATSGVLEFAVEGTGPRSTGSIFDASPPLTVTLDVHFDQPASYLLQGVTPEQALLALSSSDDDTARTSASGIRLIVNNADKLEPGDRFDLVHCGLISGRAPRFTDASIPGRDDVFFGMYYGNTPGPIGFSSSRQTISILVLKTLSRVVVAADGTMSLVRLKSTDVLKPNVAIVTHGTNSTITEADADKPSMTRVAAEMARFARDKGMDGEWDVLVFDWKEFATGSSDADTLLPFQPVRSAGFAHQIGKSLVDWLLDAREDAPDIRQLHVLAHSSGSWLSDGLVYRLHERSLDFGPSGPPHIHTTDFDAFTWPALWVGNYSANADVAERILDGRLWGTTNGHPFGANIDVAWLDPELENRVRSPLVLSSASPIYTGIDGRQVVKFFLGSYAFGAQGKFKIEPNWTSLQVLEHSQAKYPWEIFAYSPLGLSNTVGHAWPYEWYSRTIEASRGKDFQPGSVWCSTLCWERWGFVNSPMYADYLKRKGDLVEDRLSPLRNSSTAIRLLPNDADCVSR